MTDLNDYKTEETRDAYAYNISEKESRNFIGGAPYLMEHETELPKDKNGNYYIFFAQVDLKEVPELDIPLPKQGILQIFNGCDDVYGLSFDDYGNPGIGTNTLIRVITGNMNTEYELPENYVNLVEEFDASPLDNPFKRTYLTGEQIEMEPLYGSLESGTSTSQDLETDYDNEPDTAGYCFYLGGYPSFTQNDFRDDLEKFTMIAGSDSVDNVMWGDTGVASWWIPDEILPEIITNDEFEEAFIHWDCY